MDSWKNIDGATVKRREGGDPNTGSIGWVTQQEQMV